MSKAEDTFLKAWEEHGISVHPIRQHTIEGIESDAGNLRKFDFAWPDYKLIVEIDGFGWGHSTKKQKAEGAQKARDAVCLGWIVLHFTTACINSKEKQRLAVETVKYVMSLSRRNNE